MKCCIASGHGGLQESANWKILELQYRDTAEQFLRQRTKAQKVTENGRVVVISTEMQLSRMSQVQQDRKVASIIQELHFLDDQGTLRVQLPSKAAARSELSKQIAAVESRLIAAGKLSPFAAAVRVQRDQQQLRLQSRPSIWKLVCRTADEALRRWEHEQTSWPTARLTTQVHSCSALQPCLKLQPSVYPACGLANIFISELVLVLLV